MKSVFVADKLMWNSLIISGSAAFMVFCIVCPVCENNVTCSYYT